MAAQTILFLDDQFHQSVPTSSIYAVSSTANGYNKDFVRDTSWHGAWKPADSASDESITLDGGSAGWLGTGAGEVVYVAIAYDARGADQTTIGVYHDAADNPAGVFAQLKDTFTLNSSGPTVDFVDFAIPGGGKRYIKLVQAVAARGAGTKTVPIYAIAVFSRSNMIILDTDYPGVEVGPGGLDSVDQYGEFSGAGGLSSYNVSGSSFQEFDFTLEGISATMYQAIRDFLWKLGGGARCFWMQYEGLKNPAKAHFGMVRQAQARWQTRRMYVNAYDVAIRMRTEPTIL